MIQPDQFSEIVSDLMRLNDIDEETAWEAVFEAGDAREVDDEGKVVVTIHGKRLVLIWP
ncbi:MAG: hypothetical protein V4662_13825 [Verrucomicrobiota bacterium]